MAAQAIVSKFLETFKEFPPRQKAASFTIDQAMEKMQSVFSGPSTTAATAGKAA
jgi:arylsulfatase